MFRIKAVNSQVTLKNDSGKKMLVIPKNSSITLTESALTQCQNNVKALLSLSVITLNKVQEIKKEIIKESVKIPEKIKGKGRLRRAYI